MTHDQLQAQCCQWLWNEYHDERLMWHHNNNNSVNRIAGAQKKALGVVAGVLDFEWITETGMMVWIDFKVGSDRMSAKQLSFCGRAWKAGHAIYEVRTFEQFKKIIWDYKKN